MEQIIFRPKLYKFDTLKAFTDEFKVGGSDLILTNKYIYDPYSDNNKCGAQVIYQEEFGGGEPTDTMVDAIIAEASKKHFERVIAIGGGTVIDIAKVLSVSDGGSVDSPLRPQGQHYKAAPAHNYPDHLRHRQRGHEHLDN